jgi:hypothetical protein
MLAYGYDLFKEFRFPVKRPENKIVEHNENPLLLGLRGEGLRVSL